MGPNRWVQIDGSKYTSLNRRVQIDGSKQTGQNRWVGIDRSKQMDPNKRVQIDRFKQIGPNRRVHRDKSKYIGPNRIKKIWLKGKLQWKTFLKALVTLDFLQNRDKSSIPLRTPLTSSLFYSACCRVQQRRKTCILPIRCVTHFGSCCICTPLLPPCWSFNSVVLVP